MEGVSTWYDQVFDGVITQSEFLDGIEALGLDFGEGSLNLDEEQQE